MTVGGERTDGYLTTSAKEGMMMVSNIAVVTPQQQREAVRAQLSDADREYVDTVVGQGLRRVAAPTCDTCGSGGRYRLDADVVPDWLVGLIGADTPVGESEAGYPQLCRVWTYVDWLTAAEELGGRVRLDDCYSPTTTALTWCETFRQSSSDPAACRDAVADVAVWVDGVDRYRVEVWSLCPSRTTVPTEGLRSQCDDSLAEALRHTPQETAGNYYWDDEVFSWIFC